MATGTIHPPGNGKTWTETLLWTNPSPTAQFNGQDVTLSEAVDNYEYIRIEYGYNKNSTTLRSVIIPVWQDANKTAYAYPSVGSSSTGYMGVLGAHSSEDKRLARWFWILSGGSKIHFYATYNHSGSTANTICLPQYIYGIK